MIPHILCPVDFSEFSELALATAVRFAREVGGSVTALHVVKVPDPLVEKKDFVDYLSGGYKAHFKDLITRVGGEAPLASALRQGDPVTEILALAESLPAELIVIGTHSRTGMARLLLGSVAEKVIRRASVPVMTVPGPH